MSEADDIGGRKPNFGWSASGNIKVTPTGNPAPGDKVTNGTVGLQLSFPRPGYYTVQFNVVQISPTLGTEATNPLVVRPRAEIIWSVKGNSIRRVFDVTDGACVSGTGENVTVTVTDASFPTPDNEYLYFVSIQITPGMRPIQGGVQPPTLAGLSAFQNESPGPGFLFTPDQSFLIPSAGTGFGPIDLFVPPNCGVNSYLLNIAAQPDPAAGTPLVIVNDKIQVFQWGTFRDGIPLNVVNYDGIGHWNPVNTGTKRISINSEIVYTNAFPHNQTLFGSILFGIEG